MKKSLSALLALLLVSSLVFTGCSSSSSGGTSASTPSGSASTSAPDASAEAEPEIVIKVAAEVADVQDRFEAIANRAFVDHLDSHPSIKVEFYPGAALGDQTACYDQASRGQVDINIQQASIVAGVDYPNFGIFDLPYTFNNMDGAVTVLDPDSPLSEALREDYLAKTGMRLLTFTPNGFRNVTNNKREIRTPDDLKGIKLRTMSAPIQIASWEAADVLVTPMAFTELYSALQTGVVDGQENPVAVILSNSFQEVQKYMTMSRHLLSVGSMVMYGDTYDKMTPDQQAHLEESVRVYYESFCNGIKADDESMLKQIIDGNLMQVYEPTADEAAQFRAVMQPAARTLIEDSIEDAKYLDLLLEEAAKYN